jgi:hypothetical protein
MAQRLGTAAALLGDPGVLIFDAPGNGLDTEGIRWIRGLMKGRGARPRPDHQGRWRVLGLNAEAIGQLAAEHGIALHELTPRRSSLEAPSSGAASPGRPSACSSRPASGSWSCPGSTPPAPSAPPSWPARAGGGVVLAAKATVTAAVMFAVALATSFLAHQVGTVMLPDAYTPGTPMPALLGVAACFSVTALGGLAVGSLGARPSLWRVCGYVLVALVGAGLVFRRRDARAEVP